MAVAAYGYTYPVRETLKRLGGKWDRDLQIWIFDSQPEAKLTDIYFAPHPLPQNWRIVNSYRAGLPAGKVVRKLLAIGKSPENYQVICVQWPGEEWDDDEERMQPCTFSLTRPLNEEEKAKLIAELDKSEHRAKSLQTLRLLGTDDPDVLYPTTDFAEITAEAALYEFNEQQILRGGGWWVAVKNDSVWIIINNGGDGDDWSQNNMRTWGAGAIARLLPESYRPQVLELLAAAGASSKRR